MPNKNEPLLLRPSGKDYIWGGSHLNDEFEKNIDLTPLAETWECSTHPDGPSYVVGGAFDGQELAEVLKTHPEYLGERHKGENTLPILIKFIDAKKDLSVQVHPTDAYAQEHENGQLGKTEMWYVLDAGRDAKLVYGLKKDCTKADSYVFGFEESYGYLTGSYVRDKDGVDGAYIICEMFSYYATKGISLLDKLDELYKTYGYCLNTLHSYEFDGSAGFSKMQSIMQTFRGDIKEFGGKKIVKLLDYAPGLDGLPKSDVLKFLLEDNCSIVVRPSGTEPKLKTYISVSAEDKEDAEMVERILSDAFATVMNGVL